MKWARYCPACGYAMSQLDGTCRRCGLAPDAYDPEGGKQARPEVQAPAPNGDSACRSRHKAGQPRQRHRSIIIAAAAAVVLLLLEAAAVYYLWHRSYDRSQPVVRVQGEALMEALPDMSPAATPPPGRGLPTSEPRIPLPEPSGIGKLFEAQPSPHVTPTVVMGNRSEETIHVTFDGPVTAAKAIPAGGSIQFQLPRGTYAVAMWCASVARQTGTAVFRERTRYTSEWVIVQRYPWEPAEPLRMGDIE